ncbi:hypothetical protein [Micromonospora taraxaci]|uniref:LPXTG-motif cell wall-anchored protein n=1 Tax=Micromonospora taraxaci TaxID=1316803 RepID=A0A561VF26_9ACTN|nr:hypothetical protein [Micromonospora taraxaci]TWG10224.1 hypothetical protein FHU34_12678 [Micromonospora taraxaci]
MTVRRRTTRLAAVCALVGGLVLLGASPASADSDVVRVGAASSFAAGGSPQGVNVAVRKRTDGCVILRTALGLRLEGLQPEQVTVEVAADGRWLPVGVSGSTGTVQTAQTSPAKPRLCKGKGITVRYRVAIAAGVPGGRLVVTGVGLSAEGQTLGNHSDTARVTGARVTPSPTPSKTPSPTPTPTEVATVDEAVNPAALVSSAPDTKPAAAESSGGGSPVMFFGIVMVAVGLLLVVLLLRRSRQDRKPSDESPGALPGALPGNPGGTTYRAGGRPPAAPGHPGQVYGQQPPAPSWGAAPSPRPAAGGVYGAPSGGAGAVPEATQPMPGSPQTGKPPTDEGGHTVFIPRLPG